MTRGGCLCGAVRYQLNGAPKLVTHCHCGMCRKQHGAGFATYATMRRSAVEITDADGALASYRSSPKVQREFCRTCGSSLFWSQTSTPDWIEVAVGTMDGEPEREPDAHIFVGSKAAWVAICDDLPQHAELIPRTK